MGVRTKPVEGYERRLVDRKVVYVKDLPGGSRVEQIGQEFYAYDAANNYLGWSDQESAESAAKTGCVLNTQEESAHEVDLWLVWNASKDNGIRFMLGDDGWQVLSLGDGNYMKARPCKGGGFETELCDDGDLWEAYMVEPQNAAREKVRHIGWQLKVCPPDQVLRLE